MLIDDISNHKQFLLSEFKKLIEKHVIDGLEEKRRIYLNFEH